MPFGWTGDSEEIGIYHKATCSSLDIDLFPLIPFRGGKSKPDQEEEEEDDDISQSTSVFKSISSSSNSSSNLEPAKPQVSSETNTTGIATVTFPTEGEQIPTDTRKRSSLLLRMEEDEEAIRKRLAPSSPASSPVTESPIFLGHGLTPPRRMSTVESGQMDPERNRFPFCIVWTPLPLITWLLPFIGHTGICSSRGLIYDFAGSYYVSEDNMAFGWPVKVLQMDLEKVKGGANAWDKGILEANRIYRRRAHNLFCDNCHSHVAAALNQMEYEGSTNWTMFWVWWRALQGRYLNWWNVLRVWFPPVVLWGMVLTVMWAITDPVVQGIKAAQQ